VVRWDVMTVQLCVLSSSGREFEFQPTALSLRPEKPKSLADGAPSESPNHSVTPTAQYALLHRVRERDSRLSQFQLQ
jgi:hypothetical protein